MNIRAKINIKLSKNWNRDSNNMNDQLDGESNYKNTNSGSNIVQGSTKQGSSKDSSNNQ